MIEKILLPDEFIIKKQYELKSKIEEIMLGSDDDILQFFSDYIAWNGVFGGAVAELSSKWHNAIYLTKLSENEISGMRVHAHQIASHIFAAAEDEYSDKNCEIETFRLTHKDIAWYFYSRIMEFYGINKRKEVSKFINPIILETLKAYGYGNDFKLSSLIEFLGFHLGSEKIASFEFDYLMLELQRSRPKLFDYLCNKKMVEGIRAIDWLAFHATVEEEHFQLAIKSAELAELMVVRYNIMSKNQFEILLKRGFNNFSQLQTNLFNSYTNKKNLIKL